MKKLICLALSILLLACLSIQILPAAQALIILDDPIDYPIGAEGSDLSWTLDANGLLTISGTGDMIHSNQSGLMPWSATPEAVKKLVIGEGVTSVSGYAFFKCCNLTEVSLPSTLKKMEYSVFEECSSLTSLTIPAACTTIYTGILENCPALNTITVQAGNPAYLVEGGVLYNADKTILLATEADLTGTLVIPQTVTQVKYGLTNLVNIICLSIPDGLKLTASDVSNCKRLEQFSVSASSQYHSVENGVLFTKNGAGLVAYPCGRSGAYSIPAAVTEIQAMAFSHAQKLTSITIPETVQQMKGGVFYGCPVLTTAEIQAPLKELPASSFAMATTLKTVYLPDTMIKLGGEAFRGCAALKQVHLPNGLITLDSSVFEDCASLVSLALPDTVASIGSLCFRGCINLETLHFLGEKPEFSYVHPFFQDTALTIHAHNWTDSSAFGIPIMSCDYLPVESGVRCSLCGEMIPLLTNEIHEFTPWQLAADGTVYERFCVNCGLRETMDGPQTIAAPTSSYNENAQNYKVWSKPVRSNLIANSDGSFSRVEYLNNQLVCESWSAKGVFQSGHSLPMELPLYGGVYAGTDYNFVVYGKTNPDENPRAEVMRIVRYDKQWNRIDDTSLCGANTRIPFDAGSLRMVQAGDMLYILTCHTMYKINGVSHQANLTVAIHVPTMEITDSKYTVSNLGTGYASHSFNQFITTASSDLLTLDHYEGGSYGRGAVVFRRKISAGAQTLPYNAEYVTAFPFIQGSSNATGASLGGFAAMQSNNYLVVGNSVPLDSASASGCRNVFVSVVKAADSLADSPVSTIWLTSYSSDSGVDVSTPQACKLDSKRMLILWNESGSLRWTCVNQDGQRICDIYSDAVANISDCQPILSNGCVVWYTTKNGAPIFYRINTGNLSELDVLDGTSTNPVPAFSDVPESAWYASAVAWAVKNGITSGTGNGQFSPTEVCSRAQAVTFLWIFSGRPVPVSGNIPFTDVAEDAYYAKAVQWAVQQGITAGTSSTTFSPNLICTRAQIVTFLWRMLAE